MCADTLTAKSTLQPQWGKPKTFKDFIVDSRFFSNHRTVSRNPAAVCYDHLILFLSFHIAVVHNDDKSGYKWK